MKIAGQLNMNTRTDDKPKNTILFSSRSNTNVKSGFSKTCRVWKPFTATGNINKKFQIENNFNNRFQKPNLQKTFDLGKYINDKQSSQKNNEMISSLTDINYTLEEEKILNQTRIEKPDCANYEFIIGQLDSWDIEHTHTNLETENDSHTPQANRSKKKNNIFMNKTELDSINRLNEMKQRICPAHLQQMNPKVKNYLQRTEIDQKSIFLQNINLTKRKFNFDILKRENELTNEIVQIDPTEKKKDQMFDRFLFTSEEVQSQSNYDNFTSTDHYRDIIKRKTKEENEYRKEIINKTQKYYNKKSEKEKLLKQRLEILNELQKFHLETKTQIENLTKRMYKLQMRNESPTNKKPTFLKKIVAKTLTGVKPEDLTISKIKRIEDEIAKLNFEEEQTIRKANIKIEKILKKYSDSCDEIKILKSEINTLTNSQKTYYLEILRNGIDVRYQGLVWVVKRLIELNSYFEHSDFPTFIDHNQIEYLIEYSKKYVENNQLKIILKALKNRQKRLREENNEKMMMTGVSLFPQNSASDLLLYETKGHNIEQSFSPKTTRIFKNIAHKYDEVNRLSHQTKYEELAVKTIVEKLKGQLRNEYAMDTQTNFFLKTNSSKDHFNFNLYDVEENAGNISNYLQTLPNEENSQFKELFSLREAIKSNEEDLRNMKREQMHLFKLKNEMSRYKKSSMEQEIAYSALFGNGIVI